MTLVTAAIWTQPAGTAVTVAPLSAIDATRTSPVAVPAGLAIASDASAVELVVVAALWKTIPAPGAAVGVGVVEGVGIVVQVSPKTATSRVMSVISTKPSGGSGAMS